MSTSTYEILDEPSSRFIQYAQSPVLLLFVSFFIPQPFKYLMPLVFLLNAWAMGCHNLRKQVITVILGGLIIVFGFFTIIGLLVSGLIPLSTGVAAPYIRILLNASFLVLLYQLLVLQNPTYQLLSYIKEHGAAT